MPLATLLLSTALVFQQPAFDFYGFGPYDKASPRPESILGYRAGEKHTTFREQEQVDYALAKAQPTRMKIWEFGRTWENRPLKLMAISSEANIAKLEQIRQRIGRLSTGSPEVANEMKGLPAIVWVNQTIHGNESASFESGMWLAYTLSASRNPIITKALDNVVVLINPVYNPDGHERFAVWNRSLAVSSDDPGAFEGFEPEWVHGRTNHYRFDMNRDRVAFSQRETIAEVKEYARWNPQVYIDQHGQTSEYFFPPNALATNANVDRDRLEKWTQIFGRSYAKAFDKQGWLYFVRDSYDFYAATYLDTYSTMMGAIGMTHETDGGRRLRNLKPDGTPLTVELGMAKHFTTAITTILTASERHDDLMDSFYAFKRKGASGEHAGKFKRVVVTSPDARALVRMHNQLSRANIVSYFAATGFSQPSAHDYYSTQVGAQTFASGSLVIDMAQPNGQLAKAMLEPGQDFEKAFVDHAEQIAKRMDAKDFYPDPEFPEFYDITGWSLIYCHNLPAYWCETAPEVRAAPEPTIQSPGVPTLKASDVGYALLYSDQNDACAAFALAAEGVRMRFTSRPMRLGDMTLPKGSYLMMKGRNDEDLKSKLEAAATRWPGARFVAVPSAFPEDGANSPGGLGYTLIKKPLVGVIFGDDAGTSDFGGTWYLLEQEFGMKFVPLHKSALDEPLDRFSCILVPPGSGAPVDKLKAYAQNGGCVIALGSPGWAIGDNKLFQLTAPPEGIKSVPGAFFLAQLDARSFLANGYGDGKSAATPIALQVDGRNFYKGGTGGFAAAKFGDSETKLLSGWAWPNDTEKNLKGAYGIYDQPIGSGRVIVFMWNPCDRAMFPGQHKALLNAILLGPS